MAKLKNSDAGTAGHRAVRPAGRHRGRLASPWTRARMSSELPRLPGSMAAMPATSSARAARTSFNRASQVPIRALNRPPERPAGAADGRLSLSCGSARRKLPPRPTSRAEPSGTAAGPPARRVMSRSGLAPPALALPSRCGWLWSGRRGSARISTLIAMADGTSRMGHLSCGARARAGSSRAWVRA